MSKNMRFCWAKTSPFVRKVSASLKYHNLWDRVELIETLVWSSDTKHENFLQLGKIPALEIRPDYWLFDSSIICQYIDSIGSQEKLYPNDDRRFDVLRLEALVDGILDNMVLIVIEKNNRKDGNFWLSRHDKLRERSANALKYLESIFDDIKDRFDMSIISMVCMIDWVELRSEIVEFDVKKHAPNIYEFVKELDRRHLFLADTFPK